MKGHKLTAIIAVFALFAIPTLAKAYKHGTRTHRHVVHSHQAKLLSGCPLHRNAEGELIDCRGWRYRPNIGWDNTCFHLDYLPSAFACSSNGGW
jgi:hypothetical protein